MTDELTYHTSEQMHAMTLADVRALWELVPTDRQRVYRAAYDRELKAAGAEGSDTKELRIARALLKRYDEAALVPVGGRWAKAPGRVQTMARDGQPEAVSEAPAGKPSAKGLAILGGLIGIMLLFVLLRGSGSTSGALTPTPDRGATQTPLALDGQDAIVTGGDGGREAFYPVSLQITLPDDSTPRVWVVQRRTIRASEWTFDPNPDTASYLSGMAVRPVIGLPWSDDNAVWVERIGAGAAFRVQMNTGAVLHYAFTGRAEVRRSETDVFRQVEPGLALLLVGATDADGLPTATRPLITAAYLPDQELSRTGFLADAISLPPATALPTATVTATPLPFAGLDVQVIAVTTSENQITTRLRLYNGGAGVMHLTPSDFTLTLGYVENPVGPRLPADGLPPFDLLPGQAADLTLVWPWGGEPYGKLEVGMWAFGISIH